MKTSKKLSGEAARLRALGEAARLLALPEKPDSILPRVLEVVSGAVGVPVAVLVRKRFTEGDEAFALECVASWASPKADAGSRRLAAFQARDLPENVHERLENRETVLLEGATAQALGAARLVVLSPVFFGAGLYGFLALADPARANSPEALLFLSAAARLLDLFVARANVERRLEDIVEFMPYPTMIVDMGDVITGWNRSMETLSGARREKILGKGDYAHAPYFYGERRPTSSNLILRPDTAWEGTYLQFRREGHHVFGMAWCPNIPGGGAYLSSKTSKLFDVNERLCGSVHFIRDVTQERQMEKNLHRSEFMYRAVTDFSGIGMVLFRRGEILSVNDRMVHQVGVPLREMTLGHIIEWVHPEDREVVARLTEELLEGRGGPRRFEMRALHDGSPRYYRAYAQVMDHEDAPAVSFILDDITEQKELAERARLHELRMYHEDRLAALGTMAAGIAHELNQPLNTIRVVTDGLLFGRTEGWSVEEDELFENLDMVSRQVVRMSGVIQAIRDFAREDREKTADDVDPNAAVKNVFSMIGRQLEGHGIRLEKHLAPGVPPIRTSLNRLEQVVMNLVVNARQALDDCGHEDRRIWVRTEAHAGQVMIEVGDNATGIPEALIGKVFDPFFTTKDVGKGTGLGLTISQSIVAEFGGRIDVFNNEAGGATFVIIAPTAGKRP